MCASAAASPPSTPFSGVWPTEPPPTPKEPNIKQRDAPPGAASGKLKVDTHKAGECLLFSYLLK